MSGGAGDDLMRAHYAKDPRIKSMLKAQGAAKLKVMARPPAIGERGAGARLLHQANIAKKKP